MAGAASPDADISELLGIFLVLFNMSVGAALSALERRLIARHSHLRVVLRNLYRELLILGLVSFAFVMYSTIFKPSQEVFVSFEFAHILIFVLAIFYTAVVFVTAATSLSMSRHWKAIEAMEMVQYLMNKSKFAELKAERQKHRGVVWRWLLWWRGDVRRLLRYHDAHSVLNFHDIRFQFIYYRNLPAEFNFSAYLRKIKSSTFIELVEPHWTIWIVILSFLLVDLVRRKYQPSPTFDRGVIIGAALALLVLSDVLRLKISRIHWALFKHPATYYDDVSSKIARGATLADVPVVSPVAGETDSVSHEDSGAELSGHEADVEGEELSSNGGSTMGVSRRFPEHPPPPVGVFGKGSHGAAMDVTEEIPSPPSTPGRRSLDSRGGAPLSSPSRPRRNDVVLDVVTMVDLSAAGGRTPAESDAEGGRSSIDAASQRRSVTHKRRPVAEVVVPSAASILDNLFHEQKPDAGGGAAGKARPTRAPGTSGQRASVDRPAAGSRRASVERQPAGSRHASVDRLGLAVKKGPRTPVATAATSKATTAATLSDSDGHSGGDGGSRESCDSDGPSFRLANLPHSDDSMDAADRRTSASARDMSQRHSLELPESTRSLGRHSLDGPRRPLPSQWGAPSKGGQPAGRRSVERARPVLRGSRGHVRQRSADASPSLAGSSRGVRRGVSALSDASTSPRSLTAGGDGGGSRRSVELVRMAPPRLELEARHILDNGLVDGVEHSTRRGSIDLSLSSAAVAAARRLVRDPTPKGAPDSARVVGSDSDVPARSAGSSDVEAASRTSQGGSGDSSGGGGSGGGSALSQPARSVADAEIRASAESPVNHAIINRHRRVQEADEKPPRRNFPAPLLLLVPRLRRRASPAEKLFWFGSHHLYLWLAEFNLFSSTLLASIAVASYSTGAIKGKSDIGSLDVAVLTLSIAGLAYVLLRTAQSLKLYTFVLNCSGLVPEGLALDAIGEIKAARKFRLSYCSDDDSDTGSRRRRRGR